MRFMKRPFPAESHLVIALLAVLATACDSEKGPASPGDAGLPGTATDVAAPADAAADVASDTGAPTPPSACPENPVPRGQGRIPLPVDIVLTYAGKPVVFGEPFPVTGGTLTLTNFRLLLSDFALVKANGESVDVDIISDAGNPAPYNVHLVNAEVPAGLRFQLAAPPGDYVGANFLFGLNDVCNSQNSEGMKAPLDHTSQLTWPPPFGFLFLRYTGKLSNPMVEDRPPSVLDMAGVPGHLYAPRVSASGAFRVEAPARRLVLSVAIDEIFRAAKMPKMMDAGLPMPPDISFGMGENLRQNANLVTIFSLRAGN